MQRMDKGRHVGALEKMLQPKSNGGLSFRDLRLFNQALLAQQAWRLLLYPTNLCAKLLILSKREFTGYRFWWQYFTHMALNYVWTGAAEKRNYTKNWK